MDANDRSPWRFLNAVGVRWIMLGVCSVLMVSGGCKTTHAKGDFYGHDYDAALAACRKTVEENPTGKDYAYHRLFLASVAFTAGNYLEANRVLREALKVMETYGEDDTRELLALVGSEQGKVYKGDPFEKMMAHFYTGMTFYFLGEYDKALAGFKNGLGADEMSPELQYKRDCALLHFMAAKACLRLHNEDNAGMFLRLALEASPHNPYLDPDKLKQSNLTILVETGRGPEKQAKGAGQSIEVLVPKSCPEESVSVWIDGKLAGKAEPMADIFFQAKTGGKSQASRIREAKGVAGDLAMGVPLVQSKADIRTWTFLPGKVFGFCTTVSPGLHSLTLKFYDAAGVELENYQQTWYYCPVAQDSVYCFRSGVNKCNSTPDGDFRAKPLTAPAPVQYCCDAVGHVKGATPFWLGGRCCCNPSAALIARYHEDGLLLDYDLAKLMEAARAHGIHGNEEHSWCNNMCTWGPHLVHGGKCMAVPTPGTKNYEDVILGYGR